MQSVDPELWRSCGHDPQRMLGEVSAERLAQLARDRKFLRRLEDVHDDLTDYLTQPRWYQHRSRTGARLPESIAYFSPEFGITEVLPQYSGGLGILAGDHLKAASDLGVPIIGVGLLYGSGYFRQSLSATAGSWSTTPRWTRRACRSRRCATTTAPRPRGARAARRRAPCTPRSGWRRWAGCRCCCSTATSRRTTPRPAR